MYGRCAREVEAVKSIGWLSSRPIHEIFRVQSSGDFGEASAVKACRSTNTAHDATWLLDMS